MSANDNSNVTLFRWKLVDFRKQRINAGRNGLTSDIFLLQNRPSVQFVIFIQFSRMSEQDTVRVILKQFDSKPLETSVKIWIESTAAQKFNETFVEKHRFDKIDDFYGYKSLNADEYDSFLALYRDHETFYVCCELTDMNTSIIPIINCEQEFIEGFWALYEEEYHDAIVKVENTEFKVMKTFFMANSKVFKCMFTSNFKEGIKSEIYIKDIDKNTMNHLIKWLYTSKFEEDSPIEKLFTAADKYDIGLLKKLCTQRMLATLNAENAFQRLIIANLHNNTTLEEASLNCIGGLPSVNLADFLTSDEWYDFVGKNTVAARELGKLHK